MTELNFGTKGDVGSRPKRQTTLFGTRKEEGGARLLRVNPRGEAGPGGRGAPQRKAELGKQEGKKYRKRPREEPQLVGLRPHSKAPRTLEPALPPREQEVDIREEPEGVYERWPQEEVFESEYEWDDAWDEGGGMSSDSFNTSRDDSEEESTDVSESGNEGDIDSEDSGSESEPDNKEKKAPRIKTLVGDKNTVALEEENGPDNAPGIKNPVGANNNKVASSATNNTEEAPRIQALAGDDKDATDVLNNTKEAPRIGTLVGASNVGGAGNGTGVTPRGSALVGANNKMAPNVTPGMAGVSEMVAFGVFNNTEEAPRIRTLVGASKGSATNVLSNNKEAPRIGTLVGARNVSYTNMVNSTEVAPRIRTLVGESNKVAPGVSSSTREAPRTDGLSKTVASDILKAPRIETLVGAGSVMAPKKVVVLEEPVKAKKTPVKNTEAPMEIDRTMQADAFLYESDSCLESPEPIILLTPSPNENGRSPEPDASLPVHEDQGLSPTTMEAARTWDNEELSLSPDSSPKTVQNESPTPSPPNQTLSPLTAAAAELLVDEALADCLELELRANSGSDTHRTPGGKEGRPAMTESCDWELDTAPAELDRTTF